MTGPYDDGDEDVQRPDIVVAKTVIVLVLIVIAVLLLAMCGPR
jgi:ABC-type Na+ efflux pump permease subunit